MLLAAGKDASAKPLSKHQLKKAKRAKHSASGNNGKVAKPQPPVTGEHTGVGSPDAVLTMTAQAQAAP